MAGSKRELDCGAAVGRGVAALRRLREGDYWRGFPTLAGQSDVWVTAFVVAHLRRFGAGRSAFAQAQAYLVARRHPGSGWSYGEDVPPDADSTAWCLIALRGSRLLKPPALAEARDFLASHQTENGTATYSGDSGICHYIGVDASAPLAGWMSPHADVTAAALLAGVPDLDREPNLETLRRLIARQSGAGFWDAYWWRGPFYTTALVLRAIDSIGWRLPREQAERLLAALDREQIEGGGFGVGSSLEPDSFTTALALECYNRLSYLGGDEGRRAAIQALLRLQHADGGWSGEYIMRIPAPDLVDPCYAPAWSRGTGGGNSYVLDTGGVFASTLACFALASSQMLEETREARPELPTWRVPFPDAAFATASR